MALEFDRSILGQVFDETSFPPITKEASTSNINAMNLAVAVVFCRAALMLTPIMFKAAIRIIEIAAR